MQDKINQCDAEGRHHGPWEEYYPSGEVVNKGEYIHGKKHGIWIGYYPDGSLWYNSTFDISKRIAYNLYNYIDGSVLKKRFYAN